MWTAYGLYLPLSYPLSTWPLYGTCGAPAIRIGPVSLHSYLDSLSLCTCLSCLTQTLPRRMSLVNVRVNTTTFYMEAISFLSFPKQAFQMGLCRRWRIWAGKSQQLIQDLESKHSAKGNQILVKISCLNKQLLSHTNTASHSPLWWKKDVHETVSHLMFVQVGQAKNTSKKKSVS